MTFYRFCAVLALWMLWAHPSAGQTDGSAAALFREGREALKSGDYDLACDKFGQSLALAREVGTLLNLGACNEQRGRLATALRYWREGMQLAIETRDERQGVAAERALKLEPRVPTLTIRVPSTDPPSVRVRAWGEETALDPAQLGVPMKLDPGNVEVFARWSDGRETGSAVTLVERQHETLTLAPPGDGSSAPIASSPPPDEGTGLGPVRIAGIAVGAVGLVGFAVAGGLAGAGAAKNGASNDDADPALCDQTNQCGARGDALRDEALRLADGATGALVAGAVLLGAGIIMVIAAPDGAASEAGSGGAKVAVGPGTLALHVAW